MSSSGWLRNRHCCGWHFLSDSFAFDACARDFPRFFASFASSHPPTKYILFSCLWHKQKITVSLYVTMGLNSLWNFYYFLSFSSYLISKRYFWGNHTNTQWINQGQLQRWTEHSTLISQNLKPVEISKNICKIIWTSLKIV